MKYSNYFLFVLFIILFTVPSFGNTIRVPNDKATIQAGINSAVNGDTVLVSPGTYFENINFKGKKIVVTSHFIFNYDESFINTTIIDGSKPSNIDSASCVLFISGEDPTTILQGFTITNGKGTKWEDEHHPGSYYVEGGGILIQYSSPTIRYNKIINNEAIRIGTGIAGAGGGAIRCGDSSPRIFNNWIIGNKGLYGAGIVMNFASGIIKNNIITQNSGTTTFTGGSIWVYGSLGTNITVIENNTIVNNSSDSFTAGISIRNTYAIVRNNIIRGNTPALQLYVTGSTTTIVYNDIQGGYAGEGNIDKEHMFLFDFYLSGDSPCVDKGDPSSTYNDPEDISNTGYAEWPSMGTVRNDIGAFGGPIRSKIFVPLAPPDILVRDVGNGTELDILFSNITKDPNITGYKLYYKLSSQTVPDSVDVGYVNSYRFSGLSKDSTYYFSVRSYSNSNQGKISNWMKGVPRIIPLPPVELRGYTDYRYIILSWDKNKENDIKGYNIYRKTAGGNYEMLNSKILLTTNYEDFIATPDSSTTYYYVVTALDSLYESGYSDSLGFKLKSNPPAPSISVEMGDHYIQVSGTSNFKKELSGFNVYRSTTKGSGYVKVNQSLIAPINLGFTLKETFTEGNIYYYVIDAVAINNVNSNYSSEIKSAPYTFDKGLLLIDECKDGNGTVYQPSDAQIDTFYARILSSAGWGNYAKWDINSQGSVDEAELAIHSPIIWSGDEVAYFEDKITDADIELLKKYLNTGTGGKLWMVGTKMLNNIGYTSPVSFASGDFPFDYLGISSYDDISTTANFIGAFGDASAGYPNVVVNPAKFPSSFAGKMKFVSIFSLQPSAQSIYTYNSSDTTSSFHKKVCGAKVSSSAVFLGFPLYVLQDSSAILLAKKVLYDLITNVESDDNGTISYYLSPKNYYLSQNYPNPFNPFTTIKYEIPENNYVNISIYNISGQLVKTLINEYKERGYYTTYWNGKDDNNKEVSSGIYIYRIKSNDFTISRKMILLR